MVHTEATLKGLNKPDLIKLVLQVESEMNSDINELTPEIRDLVAQMKKVETDVAIVKNVNDKLVNQKQSDSVGPMPSTQGVNI